MVFLVIHFIFAFLIGAALSMSSGPCPDAFSVTSVSKVQSPSPFPFSSTLTTTAKKELLSMQHIRVGQLGFVLKLRLRRKHFDSSLKSTSQSLAFQFHSSRQLQTVAVRPSAPGTSFSAFLPIQDHHIQKAGSFSRFLRQSFRHHHEAQFTSLYGNFESVMNENRDDNTQNNLGNEKEEEYDPMKWEKMYYGAGNNSDQNTSEPAPSSVNQKGARGDADSLLSSLYEPQTQTSSKNTRSDIRVITFDLDNTLWKTSATISYANDALAEHLQQKFGIPLTKRSEKEMGRLFSLHPDRYGGLLDLEDDTNVDNPEHDKVGAEGDESLVENVGRSELIVTADSEDKSESKADDGVHIQASVNKKKKKPVYLTLLRKDAIRSMIQEAMKMPLTNYDINEPSTDDSQLESQVDKAFEIWMQARTQSISQNYAQNAVECLLKIRSSIEVELSRNSDPHRVYIGAITDGNSNPLRVPELSNLFDFVIRAEDVGISKPDKRVYKAAVAALMVALSKDGRNVEQFFLGESVQDVGTGPLFTASNWKDIDDEAVKAFSDAVGPWWCHIGDDFFKDVVAAKEFRMRTVWVRELIGGDPSKAATGDKSEAAPKERTVEDLVKDISNNKGVIEMSIGDSEFLMSALHEEFSDAILDRFDDLGDLLIQWHEEGKMHSTPGLSETGNILKSNLGKEGYIVSDSSALDGRDQYEPEETEEIMAIAPMKSSKKFCMFCGEQLPPVAKFCSGCGERQM